MGKARRIGELENYLSLLDVVYLVGEEWEEI